jgi:chemotaxis signal transduction protein
MSPAMADLASIDPVHRLAELRHSFDISFTRPTAQARTDTVDLLAVTVGADSMAVPLTAMSGLIADRAVTRLPGSPPDLLGVVGLRGHLIPAYDLVLVLGRSRPATSAQASAAQAPAAPRWLLLAAGSPPMALAVDDVDGHLRVPLDAIAEPEAGRASAVTPAVASTPRGPLPVIDIPAVRTGITARAQRARAGQEAVNHASPHHV